MQPVLPRTMVRGPAALTIIFITKDDSHPWQVRWPEVKNSSSGSFFTPLNASSFCVGWSFTSSANSLSLTAMSSSSYGRSKMQSNNALLAHADPLRPRLRLSLRGPVDTLGHLPDGGHRDLATSEAADEAEDGRPLRGGVHRRAHLGREDPAPVRRAQREVAVDDAHRLEASQRRRQLLG